MQATTARTLVEVTTTETDVAALVWDRAPSHRDARARAMGLPLLSQPPYAPELNSAERVFEDLRAAIEGVVYPSIANKVAAVEAILEELDACITSPGSHYPGAWFPGGLHHMQRAYPSTLAALSCRSMTPA